MAAKPPRWVVRRRVRSSQRGARRSHSARSQVRSSAFIPSDQLLQMSPRVIVTEMTRRGVTSWPSGSRSGDDLISVGAGNQKEIVVPCPHWLSALTLPPWASTRCLTIARPRPVPPSSRERPGRPGRSVRRSAGDVRGDSRAGIAHREPHSGFVRRQRHRDAAARLGVAQRIVEQIGQDLPQRIGVGLNAFLPLPSNCGTKLDVPRRGPLGE